MCVYVCMICMCVYVCVCVCLCLCRCLFSSVDNDDVMESLMFNNESLGLLYMEGYCHHLHPDVSCLVYLLLGLASSLDALFVPTAVGTQLATPCATLLGLCFRAFFEASEWSVGGGSARFA